MAQEAFVCPHCRTWVEGSGRTIRCSSCGKRFRADEARLGRPRTPATFETLDYDVPQQQGWDLPGDERHAAVPGTREPEANGWREPEVLTYDSETAPDWETPAQARVEPDTRPDPWATPAPGPTGDTPDTKPESTESETPWGWIFGIALLLLFVVGGRFLSGELFAAAFVAIIAAQWLLGRKEKG